MTPAQQHALRRAVDADGPVKISPATAAVLSERYHFIRPASGGWVPTDGARAYFARIEHARAYSERRAEIPTASKAWAERVMAWLACHGYVGGMDRFGPMHAAQEYAEHYAACTHAGLEPVRPNGDPAWVEDDVRMAAECLRDFDAAYEKATARGCGVDITYGTAKSHPKAKPDAALARPDGTVDLRAYRLARPEKPGGAA